MNAKVEGTAGRLTLMRWMFSVTRPVLSPLVFSALLRVGDQLAGVMLVAFGTYQGVAIALQSVSGRATSWADLTGPLLLMVVLAAVKAFLRYGEQFLGHYVAFRALELLRAEVFTILAPQAPAVTRQLWSGDLLSRITRDIDRIEAFFAHTFAPAVAAVAVPGGVCVAMWLTLGPEPALVAFFCYLCGVFLVPIVGGKIAGKQAEAALCTRGEMAVHLGDTCGGLAEIVGYGGQSERLKEQGRLGERLLGAAGRRGQIVALRQGFSQLLQYGGAFCLILVCAKTSGGVGVAGSGIGTGTTGGVVAGGWMALLAAAVLAFIRSWKSVRAVAEFTQALDNSFAGAGRIFALRDLRLGLTCGGKDFPAGPLEVCVKDVDFTYPVLGGRQRGDVALRGVNISFPAGSWTAVVGSTGSGKSTLAALILRYFDPQVGSVTIGDINIRETPVEQLRSVVASAPQRAHIFRGTLAENLKIAAPNASTAQLWEVLEVAQLAGEVRALPAGLDTAVGERGMTLSGGQRQRLALARVLLQDARVIVLDEFTAHLDVPLAARVRAQVRAARPDATVIEITHRLGQLDGVDQVVEIDCGEVISTSWVQKS